MNRIGRIAAILGVVMCALGVLAASASAVAPEATTLAATSVKDTRATLNGTVDAKGLGTNYRFEYGPTTSYGFQVPFAPASAGSGGLVAVNQAVAGLNPSTLYHYRIRASNTSGTAFGADMTFTTAAVDLSAALGGMATTEPFDGSAGSLSNFSSNWAALGWAAGKGEDSSNGWHPAVEYPTVNGAYLNQTLADAGQGLGVSSTLAVSPGSENRYASLWLDMSNPAAASRAGYELRLVYEPAGTYKVTVFKWLAGVSTSLATQSAVALAPGSSVALTDVGSSVKAWTNTGSGFKQLLSATDSAFSGGKVGVEGAGNVTRLTKFKAGALLTPVANISEAIAALTLRDPFLTVESPLSGAGAWGALAWDNSPDGHNTGQVFTNGWGPANASPTVNGANWQKATFADTGAGSAVTATAPVGPGGSKSFSLWLDMPSPTTAKTGYEARFVDNGGGNAFETSVVKWQAGVKSATWTLGWILLPAGPGSSPIVFVDKGSTLSLYLANGSTYFQPVSSVTDATFNGGFAGMESPGNPVRLRDFRAGPLSPF